MTLTFSRLTLLAALTALATACAGEPPPPQYIVVTGDPNAAMLIAANITATSAPPTLSPTSAIPPTPTVPPDTILRLADRYLLNGYYEDAVAAYTLVLGQEGVPDDIRAAAGFNLGRAALLEGLFDQSAESLTSFLSRFPNDTRASQAYFLRGDAYLGLSRWREAIADFRAYLAARPGLVDSYALERIADAHVALGETTTAITTYQQAADASRSLVPQLALRERLAQVLIANSRLDEAIAQYDAILGVARNAPYRASIAYAAAVALVGDGSTPGASLEAGLTRMQTVFDQYVDRPEAYNAWQALKAAGRAVNAYQAGRAAFYFGEYNTAIEQFNEFTTSAAAADVPAELYLLQGQAYREIGSSAAALTAFETIIERYPNDPLFADALLEPGRTYWVGGDADGAIARYLSVAETYPTLPQAAEALWRAGYLSSTEGDTTIARGVFERLADAYPDSEWAADGLFQAASDAAEAGDTAAAERFYSELAIKATGEDQAAAYLQVGRLAIDRGDQAAASAALSAAAAFTDTYYGARAGDLAAGRVPFLKPAGYSFALDDGAEIARAETWLRERFSIAQEGTLWTLAPALQSDPRVLRGTELWTLGAIDEAETEFSDLLDENETNALASYQLAIYLRGIAAYPSSIVAAANVIRTAGVTTTDAPPYIARMRYPAYYLDVVQEAAAQQGLDPLLIFSLIRHESLFDTYATAAAGEKGLTQVIPPTGEYIASQLAWPDYQHSDLFRPYAGVAFGAYYLGEQMRTFDGNGVAALAGYNAGPGRAYTWLEAAGDDPDRFMRAITISSTQLYVQRIYTYFNVYRALYGV